MSAPLRSLRRLVTVKGRAADKARGRRLAVLAQALSRPLPYDPGRPMTEAQLHEALSGLVRVGSAEETWLALAVMSAAIPSVEVVTEIARECELLHTGALASAVVAETSRDDYTDTSAAVEVVPAGSVLVDVSATLVAPFTTGVQRVVRETVSRWEATHEVLPVAWTHDYRALRRLTAAELDRVRTRRPSPSAPTEGEAEEVNRSALLIPWRCTFLQPEVMAERPRSTAMRGVARLARCQTGAISYDLVPITFSETLIDWFGDTFAFHLSALRHFDRVAAISEATAQELDGWRRALGGTGWPGPAIGAVSLPSEVPDPAVEDPTPTSNRLLVGDLPMVLVVGSSEPRKNHDAILYAAEMLWRRGHRFSLTFVGGRAWGTSDFARTVDSLSDAGRAIDVATGLNDSDLYRAYRLARFTVFPSLGEGFGLPVAESLACGTPVITSNFGSMKEIAAPGGAIQVDPHSDSELIDAMELLLTDDDLVRRLRSEASQRRWKTWDEYAEETWSALVDGQLVDISTAEESEAPENR